MKFQEHSLLSLTFYASAQHRFPELQRSNSGKCSFIPPPIPSQQPLLNIHARIKYSFTYKFCIQKQTVTLVLFMTFILPAYIYDK